MLENSIITFNIVKKEIIIEYLQEILNFWEYFMNYMKLHEK